MSPRNRAAIPLSKLLIHLARTQKASSQPTSADLLAKHGFVKQSGSGIYEFLPLGLRVQKNVCNIIRKHLDSAGCFELELSTLVNPNLWVNSGRLNPKNANEELLFSADKKYLLAPTGEEQITTAVGSVSYKQLPLSFYQINRKFRNELRPRGGILRSREFLMKDLYTFDATSEAAHSSYSRIQEAYRNIFDAFGVPYIVAEADSGDMGGSLSHEYHYASQSGEDTVARCTSCGFVANLEMLPDLKNPKTVSSKKTKEKTCPQCSSSLAFDQCIEVGHTFYLGDRYSKPLKSMVTLKDGAQVPMEMGCYGIGVTRIIGAVAEKMMDENGLRWPKAIAPFPCIVVSNDTEAAKTVASALASSSEYDVAFDDRTSQIGQAMRDARESGIPLTLVVGKSWKNEGLIEILPRTGLPRKAAQSELPRVVSEMLSP